jgi:hypothetical protein
MCGGLRVDTDVIQNPPDLRALGNECDQAHLSTALRAPQREDFVDARYQHGPQGVRRALGWHRFGRRWTRMAQRHHSSCAARSIDAREWLLSGGLCGQ